MAEITASMVKELRTKTGAGMMDCKKALQENDGDMDAAIDWLRKKGLAAAAKKSGRVAAEGLVALRTEGNKGAVIELNSETDFVARNEQFQKLAADMVEAAVKVGDDVAAILASGHPNGGSIQDQLTGAIATIGENMNLRRASVLEVDKGVVSGYVHGAIADGLGKIAVLVALESEGDADKLKAFGKQLAMHIAATNPRAVSIEDMDQEAVAHEREVLSAQARESGKPENIIEKMVEGRIRKFYQEVVLLEQTFVIDGESKVAKAVEAAAKDAGAPIKVAGFVRLALGEGIEKKEDDFAAEVASMAG